jgi:catechol 2,3-dioxygenase-like lactoylglutathione lyase family enzyme
MFKDTEAFSGFSVSDIDAAQKFYGETLGLNVEKQPEGLALHLAGGGNIFVYPKPNHEPATFTVLNFKVADIEKAVADLKGKGVKFEEYDAPGIKTDEDSISRGSAEQKEMSGPKIAWFKDPAGNIISVLQGY